MHCIVWVLYDLENAEHVSNVYMKLPWIWVIFK
jgi:hypothetical protein